MILLGAVAAIVLVGIGAERLSSYYRTNQRNVEKERQLIALKESAVKSAGLEDEYSLLTERIEGERAQLYAPGEIDRYRFGVLVNDLLTSNGIEIESTKMAETEGRTVLEYVLHGPTPGILEFLRSVAGYEKRLDIPYISLRTLEGGAIMHAVMRIAYAQYS